jgi:hypothetical protein
MDIDLRVDLRALKRGLSDVRKKQLPFATAQALTVTAGHVGEGWIQEMKARLETPTPFTLGSVAVRGASKGRLVATVFVKDIAAAYLSPLIDGGPHALGKKKGLLNPKNVPLNQYGNLSRGKIAALKAKPNVFVGPVTLKSGQVVNGVWQRNDVARGARRKGGYGTKGSHHVKHNEAMGLTGYNNRTTLKLLVRFTDPLPAKPVLRFGERAAADVRRYFEPAFEKAFAHAMATAR